MIHIPPTVAPTHGVTMASIERRIARHHWYAVWRAWIEARKPQAPTPDGPHQECYDCGELLPLTNEYFYRHPTTSNGFDGRCRTCKRDYDRRRRERLREAAEGIGLDKRE